MARLITLMVLVLLALTACAPDDLDITPTATSTPTLTPAPTTTPRPTLAAGETEEPEAVADASAAEEAPVGGNRQALDAILASIPDTITAGPLTWRKTNAEVDYQEPDGGVTGRVAFTANMGGNAELTYGVFDTPEAATANFERLRDTLRVYEAAESRENFPQPNAFGKVYSSWDAMFVQENIFIRVAVPQAAGSAGDPIIPLSRQAITILETALAS
jgi:hypothetical protein